MHTPTSLFADMLGLLKRVEFNGAIGEADDASFDCCPVCEWQHPEHAPGCHLQATIALAEEHASNA
jgi:hypothetical protein